MAAEEAKSFRVKSNGKQRRTDKLISRLSSRIPNFVTSSNKTLSADSLSTKSSKAKQTSTLLNQINKNRGYKRVVSYHPSTNNQQNSSPGSDGHREDKDARFERSLSDSKEDSRGDFITELDSDSEKARQLHFDESEKSTQKYSHVASEESLEADQERVAKPPLLGTIAESNSISSMSQHDKIIDNLESQVHPMPDYNLQTAPLQAINENSKDDLFTSFSKSFSKLGSSNNMLQPNKGNRHRYSSKYSTKYKKEEDAPADNFTYNPGTTCFLGDEGISSVFLLKNPMLYFETVQALIMLISLYIALWLTNFLVAAKSIAYIIISLLPGLLSAVVYLYVVKSAALLKAIHVIDNDAVLEVLEQTEGSQLLGETIRKKILERLKELGEPQAELYNLFNEIDSSGNGWLR